jgi:uncharacterized membrane protein YsdA (DUF1294 family)/cold shock CspA family protein
LKAPRYQGKITSWKDEGGFGFITPNGGGPTVFVHIKAFTGPGRPVGNEIVTYELTTNGKGQVRAENVAFVRAGTSRRRAAFYSRTRGLLAATAFLAFVGACVLAGKLPLLALGLYLGLSACAFAAYAVDKSAARAGRRRTPESSLHLLGLLGGWPGALVAQLLFRHKSKKPSFRRTFWMTVVLNCALLVWLLSSWGAVTLEALPR